MLTTKILVSIFRRLVVANRELRGIRVALSRLISAAIALFLSIIGIPLIITGYVKIGLIFVSISLGLLACAQGLSAINTLKTLLPLIQRGRK